MQSYCADTKGVTNVKARQRYHSDIKRKLSTQDLVLEGVTQDLVLEGVAQDEDNTQAINLKDWSISFK